METYYHMGIDIPARFRDPAFTVRSVSNGKATFIQGNSARHDAIEVTDSDNQLLFEYLHVATLEIHDLYYQDVAVKEKDALAQVVRWYDDCTAGDEAAYHHLHFGVYRCDDTGTCGSDSPFALDPLVGIASNDEDRFKPRMEGVYVVPDESPDTLAYGSGRSTPSLDGKVDIVLKMYDKFCSSDSDSECAQAYKIGAYDLGFRIENEDGRPVLERRSVFPDDGIVPNWKGAVQIFRETPPLESLADYCGPNNDEYYYAVTNSVVVGREGYWDTNLVENGDYVITVHATDQKGNRSQKALRVKVANGTQ